MQIQWFNLTLNVYIDSTEYDDNRAFRLEEENIGNCRIYLDKEQFLKYYGDGNFTSSFEDCTLEEDNEVTLDNADDLICFLNYLYCNNVKDTITIHYEGSRYWFFHDLIHAELDYIEGNPPKFSEFEGHQEENALLLGAISAANHNVSIADIVTELADAEKEFHKRFDYESNALYYFCKKLKYVPS